MTHFFDKIRSFINRRKTAKNVRKSISNTIKYATSSISSRTRKTKKMLSDVQKLALKELNARDIFSSPPKKKSGGESKSKNKGISKK